MCLLTLCKWLQDDFLAGEKRERESEREERTDSFKDCSHYSMSLDVTVSPRALNRAACPFRNHVLRGLRGLSRRRVRDRCDCSYVDPASV